MRQTVGLILIATAVMSCAMIAPVLLNFSRPYERAYDDRAFPALSGYALKPTSNIACPEVGDNSNLREIFQNAAVRYFDIAQIVIDRPCHTGRLCVVDSKRIALARFVEDDHLLLAPRSRW